MQLTIDSTQPLDDVLRVVGAMYNVTLVADGKANGHRNGLAKVPAQRRGGSTRRHGKSASTAEVRAWALANGYEVGSKGRISQSLVDAYRAARR